MRKGFSLYEAVIAAVVLAVFLGVTTVTWRQVYSIRADAGAMWVGAELEVRARLLARVDGGDPRAVSYLEAAAAGLPGTADIDDAGGGFDDGTVEVHVGQGRACVQFSTALGTPPTDTVGATDLPASVSSGECP